MKRPKNMNAPSVTTSHKSPIFVEASVRKLSASNASTASKEILTNVLSDAPSLSICKNAKRCNSNSTVRLRKMNAKIILTHSHNFISMLMSANLLLKTGNSRNRTTRSIVVIRATIYFSSMNKTSEIYMDGTFINVLPTQYAQPAKLKDYADQFALNAV